MTRRGANRGELDDYLREFRKLKFLSPEEERELIAAAQTGDAHAINRLILTNMRFIAKIAHGLSKVRNFKIPLEDACQEGVMGLLRAIEDFELSRGLRLHTYAYQWIRRYILLANYQYLAIRVPVSMFDPGKVAEASEELRERADVALGCMVASDFPPDSDGPVNWESLFGAKGTDDETDSVQERERVELQKEKVHGWLGDLGYKESKVIRERFGFDDEDPKTLDRIAESLGVTKERVRQIEVKALGRLARSGGDNV